MAELNGRGAAHRPGARAHYDRRREAGARHTAAQRNLFNRFLGCLHHCLTRSIDYDESTVFPTHTEPVLAEAARQINHIGCLAKRPHRRRTATPGRQQGEHCLMRH